MKKWTGLLIMTLLLTASEAHAQSAPSLQSVIEQFYKTYQYPKEYPFQLKFSRKKEGWFVYEKDAQHDSAFNETLFWSFKDKKYMPLPFAPGGTNYQMAFQAKYYREYIYEEYRFGCCRYYGYDGWDRDMIRDFGPGAERLDDTTTEGLYRAYCNYAMSFINNQYGYSANKKLLKDLNAAPGLPVPVHLADSFERYETEAIRVMKILMDRNPGYQTIVGNMRNKWSNEYLHVWNVLNTYGYPERAAKYMVPGLYDKNTLVSARNYLSSVAQNAIFISNGDNDTYPLWYVQQQEGFRKDVKVMNNSLLGLPRYILKLHKDSTLKFMLKADRYASSDYDYVTYHNSGNMMLQTPCIKASEFFTFLNKKDGSNRMPASADMEFRPVIYPNSCIIVNMDNDPGCRGKVEINTNTRGYLLLSDLAVHDLFASNAGTRPFYFTASSGNELYSPYKNALSFEGMAYRVCPSGQDKDSIKDAAHAARLKNYLLNQWQPYSFEGSATENYRTLRLGYGQYHKIYYLLYSYYRQTGDKAEATSLLNRWKVTCPINKDLFVLTQLYQGEALLKAEDNEGVTLFFKAWMEMLNSLLPKADKYEQQDIFTGARYSIGLLEEHGMNALAEELKKKYAALTEEK